MVEQEGKRVERESLHGLTERQAMYVIMDAVFGLSLGLGAFSLTELPIMSAGDLFMAVGFFAFSYFVIFMSWATTRRYFVGYTVYGPTNGILFFTGFFVAIMPIQIRIILMHLIEPTSLDVFNGALTLYSLCLSAVTITVGIFSFVFARQSWKTTPWDDLVHVLTEGVFSFALGLVFLTSALIPYETSIIDVLGPSIVSQLPQGVASLPFKVGFWFLGGLAIAVPAFAIARLILWLKRPRKTEA